MRQMPSKPKKKTLKSQVDFDLYRKIRLEAFQEILALIEAEKERALKDFDPEDSYICAFNGMIDIVHKHLAVKLGQKKDRKEDITVSASTDTVILALLRLVGGSASFTIVDLARAEQKHLDKRADGHTLRLVSIGDT